MTWPNPFVNINVTWTEEMVSDLRRRFNQAKKFVPLCSRVRTLSIYHLHVDVIRHIQMVGFYQPTAQKRICSYEMGVTTVQARKLELKWFEDRG